MRMCFWLGCFQVWVVFWSGRLRRFELWLVLDCRFWRILLPIAGLTEIASCFLLWLASFTWCIMYLQTSLSSSFSFSFTFGVVAQFNLHFFICLIFLKRKKNKWSVDVHKLGNKVLDTWWKGWQFEGSGGHFKRNSICRRAWEGRLDCLRKQ